MGGACNIIINVVTKTIVILKTCIIVHFSTNILMLMC